MDEGRYLQRIDERVDGLLRRQRFVNERAQIRSMNTLSRLSPEAVEGVPFTYSEERAWTHCRYLVSAGARSIDASGVVSSQTVEALRTAAEIIEHLAEFTTQYDRSELRLLSALCYYAAGYQANAVCMARQLEAFARESHPATPSPDVAVYEAVRAFLERDLAGVVRICRGGIAAVMELEERLVAQLDQPDQDRLADVLFISGVGILLNSLMLSAQYGLQGNEPEFEAALDMARLARESFHEAGDVVLANLSSQVVAVFVSAHSRATWHVIRSRYGLRGKWEQYLSVLASQAPPVTELWPSQVRALEAGVADAAGGSYIIRMPTSSGKTRVAEMAILGALEAQPGAKCVYIAPYRALSDEVHRCLSGTLGRMGCRVTGAVGSYDTDEFRSFLQDQSSVLVGTPEKIDLLLRTQPAFFDNVGLVVLDEAHIVDDRERGPRCELLLTRLKRRLLQRGTRFLCLSAVMPNPADFAQWLCDAPDRVVATEWRPARQRLAKLYWTRDTARADYVGETGGELQFVPRLLSRRSLRDYTPKIGREKTVTFPRRNHKSETAAELALKLCHEGPTLVFCAQTQWVKSTAEALLRGLQLYAQSGVREPDELAPLGDAESLSTALEWLGESHPLVPCLRRRIGMHYRNLPESVKQAIEDDFRRGVLRVLVSTNTLGQGVNLPVRHVIVHSVSRWIEGRTEEDQGRSESIKVRDYWNICGRAGRAGNETEGQIFHLVETARDEELLQAYARRDAMEPTISALFALLAELAARRISDEELLRYLDSQLLTMLVEEGIDEMSQDDLRSILSSSLVGVQCSRLNCDITPLAASAWRAGRTIVERVADRAQLELFASTGLSFSSCSHIMQQAIADAPKVAEVGQLTRVGQLDALIALGIAACLGIREAHALKRYPGDAGSLTSLAQDWVHGVGIQALKDKYWPLEPDSEEACRFIEDAFSLALPWVLNAYGRFVRSHLQQLGKNSPAILDYLPTMVRFGVDTPEACWARTAGAPSRQGANALAEEFLRAHPMGGYRAFVGWFDALTQDDLAGIPGLAAFEVRRILSHRG